MALGPRGAGKDLAALNHLGEMTGRSKVSTQGFLEEKAHMVKMDDYSGFSKYVNQYVGHGETLRRGAKGSRFSSYASSG